MQGLFKQKVFQLSIILIAGILLTACSRIQPITNYNQQNIPVELSMAQVKQAITQGAEKRKWVVTEVNSNKLQATYTSHSHVAVVDIPYSTKQYSLIYASSKNLDADGNMIHYNYNRWVRNLNKDIQSEFNQIPTNE
ncbi:MAG: hypothetical protein EP298_05560 [Gammaproteobacteria bacterium]|nr:MAG: hypothetical protein EP298_05560 [Gammaproteobacteria bacterium]UTW42741.1 hypothetical protein KFE69_00925 [bacterium SCSIO 12844]